MGSSPKWDRRLSGRTPSRSSRTATYIRITAERGGALCHSSPGPTPSTSAPGRGPPRCICIGTGRWARHCHICAETFPIRCHICAETGLDPARSFRGLPPGTICSRSGAELEAPTTGNAEDNGPRSCAQVCDGLDLQRRSSAQADGVDGRRRKPHLSAPVSKTEHADRSTPTGARRPEHADRSTPMRSPIRPTAGDCGRYGKRGRARWAAHDNVQTAVVRHHDLRRTRSMRACMRARV